ncbi:glycan biosynthesis hexose transferase WsfD [Companilactobacillus zhachilii]|uniref:glycan biosynthesis hexose transferase WsfD n=1 Tax=Companilactobacillus zhachilii TaxID=2304606 RepID=UPI004033F316
MLATILVAIVCGIVLFIPPINGLADNGDFYNTLLSNDLYRFSTRFSQYNNFVIEKFGILQYYNGNHVYAVTSQLIFVRLALILNKIFYSRTIFDIRFMGVVNTLFYLGGIYLLTNSLVYPLRKVRSYVVALLTAFIFGDAAYILFFNSFFAETQMLIFTVYLFAAIMSLARDVYQHHWPMIILFFTCAIMLILSRQQNASLTIPLIVISLGMLFLPNFRARRMVIIFGSLLILVSGMGIYLSTSQEARDANKFESFSHGVLIDSSIPTKRIERGGLDGQFALVRGSNYYADTYASIKSSGSYVKQNLLKKEGINWVTRYYLANPKQFFYLLNVAAADITNLQPKDIGDYPRDTDHKALSQYHYFTIYSAMVGILYPAKYAFDCLIALSASMCYAVGFYLDIREQRHYGILRFFLILGLMIAVVFIPIYMIITAGESNLSQHLFMVATSLNLTFLLFIDDVLNHTLWHTKGKIGDDE